MPFDVLNRLIGALHGAGVRFFAFVPGEQVGGAHQVLAALDGVDAQLHDVLREDVALSMAVGAWLAGTPACVLVDSASAPVLAGAMGRLVGPARLGVAAVVAAASDGPDPAVWFEATGVPCVHVGRTGPGEGASLGDSVSAGVRAVVEGLGPRVFVVGGPAEDGR